MNERVSELIAQAMEPTGVEGIGGSYMELNAEKLVDLVVQRCISQIALLGISNYENEDISWTASKAIEFIREDFGLEK